MKRLTNEAVRVDESVDKYLGPLMDVMWCVWLTPQMQGVQTVFKPLMRPEKEN